MKRIIAILLLLTACKKDKTNLPDILNPEEFTKVENSSILVSLKPSTAYEYVELRMSSGEGPLGNEMYLIRAYTGDKMQLEGSCLETLENLPAQETGFAEDCTPICFFNYVVAAKGKEVAVVNSLDELKDFLGNIDSESDAALLTVANGYEFDFNNKEVAGVKKVKDGYEVLCKKRVKSCSPIQYDQFWLHISTNGTITIKKEILYSTLDACI
jgi:hypothetical protein